MTKDSTGMAENTPNSKDIAKDVVSEFLVDVRFQHMIKGLLSDVIDDKLTKVNERLDSLERKCEGVNTRCDIQEGELFTFHKKTDSLCELCNKLEHRIDTIENILHQAEMAIVDTQQYTRRNCLLISGIPESIVKDEQGKLIPEDTDKVVIELAKKELGVELKPEDLDRTHRTAKSQNEKGKPRAIIREDIGTVPAYVALRCMTSLYQNRSLSLCVCPLSETSSLSPK